MRQDVLDKLASRATVLNNIDGLVSYGLNFNKNKQQMSLFEDVVESKMSLNIPENIEYEKLLEQEKDVLGVYLTHNPFDDFILVRKKFCNNTIEGLLDVQDDCKSGIVLIARINEVKKKHSKAGNQYSKLMIGDSSSNFMVYLWGDKYNKLSPHIFNNNIYLIELGFRKDGNTFFVVNMKNLNSFDISRFVKKIIMHISDVEDIPKTREYIISNMIGNTYNLSFVFGGEIFDAPYKINFNGDNYNYLKNYITDLRVSNG
jgi:DNA polymerase-3 subunit alpha